jgi:chromosome segregation ATPase
VEKRAKGAESKVVELEKANEKIQAELREMTKSYKTDVSRLEEAASSAEHLKIELQRKENNLADVHERCKHLENELKIISTELAREKDAKSEARAELKALQCQRVSSSDALQQHVTEIDAAKMENLALKSSVEKLKNDLDCEKAVAETLKAEIIALKSTGSVVATRKVSTKATFQSMAPAPLSPTPSYKQQGRSLTLSVATSSPLSGRNFQVPARAVSPSMQGNSVKAIAAAFEPSPPGTPRAVFAGFRQAQSKQEPCAPQDAERGLDRQKVEELRLQIEMGERKIIELEGMKQKAHEQKRAEIEELQYQLGQEVEKNAAMEEKLKSQSMVIGELRAEVATLTATRTAIQSLSRKEFEEQSKKDREEILRLRMEMDGLRDELQSEMKEVETLKSEIRSMTLDRINQEENAMGSYDNKIEANQRSFDVEVNALQMQLTKEQMRNARLESDYQIQIKELEDTIEELNFECDKELDAKQAELDMMKHKLAESLDAVAKLESERDQLCISMNTQSNARKTQFDELQSELLQKTAENAQLARDIEKLQMHVKLDEDLSDELEHLREKVKEFEAKQRSSNSGTMKHMESMQVNSLRAENNKLRDTVRQVAMEKQALQTKLNTLIEDKSESKSLQIFRERNDSLKLEVDRLTKKLQRRRNEQRFEL